MNPFKSKAQQRFLFANKQKIAKEFADKTKNIKKLPEYTKDKKMTKSAKSKVKKILISKKKK